MDAALVDGWKDDDTGLGGTYRADPGYVHVPRFAGAVPDGCGTDGGVGEDRASGLLQLHVNFVMPVPSPLPVALRTYSLAFALSLSPSLFSFVVELVAKRRLSSSSLSALRRIFKRELRHDGFAFAITLAVAGGNAIRYFWDEIQLLAQSYKATFRSSTCLQIQLTSSKLSDAQKTFISTAFSSAVGFTLLQTGRQRWRQQKYPQQPKQSLPQNTASLTLDLTMLLFVRAVDVVLQLTISRVQTLGKRNDTEPKERQRIRDRRSLVSRIDAFIFWACSAR